jgi:hypothetical protein
MPRIRGSSIQKSEGSNEWNQEGQTARNPKVGDQRIEGPKSRNWEGRDAKNRVRRILGIEDGR